MKKLNILLIIILFQTNLFSQVGIGTNTPNATLEVTGQPSVTGVADGIIAPRISRADLIAKTAYSTSQTGAIIYITDLSGTVNTATQKITEIGYYYFNGTSWYSMNNNSDVLFSFGDIKQGIQSADHNGWIKLDGRAINTLTTSQQTQAENLGLTINLPDATNTQLTQNGTSLGSVSGSNTKTIARNQLPNVNLTGTTSSGGANGRWKTDSSPWATDGFSYTNITTQNGAESGLHTHNISLPLNGNVPQQDFNVRGAELSVNVFIYLGD